MRDRSRSPSSRRGGRDRDSYPRRDYGGSGGGYGDEGYGGHGGFRGGRGRGRGGGFRGGRGRGGGFNRGRGRGGYGGYGRSYSSYRDPEATAEEYRDKTDRNYDNSVFIGNIPYDLGPQDVKRIFSDDFNVIRADIVTNRGMSRGMATVEFGSKEDVKGAIERYDHHEFRGREIFVRQDYPPPEEKRMERSGFNGNNAGGYGSRGGYGGYNNPGRGGRGGYDRFGGRSVPPREKFGSSRQQPALPRPEPGTEVFIGNIPFSLNWQDLKDLMREVGEVKRADIRLDRYGKSMGYGTVVFNSVEEANQALEKFQGYEIEGRKLDTRPGKIIEPREEQPVVDRNSDFVKGVTGDGEKSDTIYVKNLPFVTTVDDLYELFETIGKVTHADLQYNPNGKTSGNGVVQFEVEELADLAIKNLNNYNYGGRDLEISYANRTNGSVSNEDDRMDESIAAEPQEEQPEQQPEEEQPQEEQPQEEQPQEEQPQEQQPEEEQQPQEQEEQQPQEDQQPQEPSEAVSEEKVSESMED